MELNRHWSETVQNIMKHLSSLYDDDQSPLFRLIIELHKLYKQGLMHWTCFIQSISVWPSCYFRENCSISEVTIHTKRIVLFWNTSGKDTAISVFLWLSIYSKTRKEHLVVLLYENGLNICYDIVLSIHTTVAESVAEECRCDDCFTM